MQTAQHPSARSGRIWRLFTGEPADPGRVEGGDIETLSPQASDTLDLVDEALAPREDRLERLEAGIRLLAGALKRVHHDLSSAMAELRQDLAQAATASDVE